MSPFKAYNLLFAIWSLLALSACVSSPEESTTPFISISSEDVDIEWAGGMHGLKSNLGVAGSCPTPEFLPHEIPNELGVGFGVCFIPRIKGAHATLGILYTITLPGDGVINPETNERIKQVNGYASCFNGRRCFGGYIPEKNDFSPGEWIFEFYRINRKIIKHSFVVQTPIKQLDEN